MSAPAAGASKTLRVYRTSHMDEHMGAAERAVQGHSDIAQRGTCILSSLQGTPWCDLTDPVDVGIQPIEDVHDAAYVGFVRTAFQRLAENTRRDPTHLLVVPNIFGVGPMAPAVEALRGKSIWADIALNISDHVTPMSKGTYTAAYWASQCALSATQHVMKADALEEQAVAYALCRPPGHHAFRALASGFCFFNNAAIAAQYLVRTHGHRVCVLDVDYHHGNGTQSIFYDRADVLYVSLHADPIFAYPHFLGFANETGKGAGEGFNINFPLPPGTDGASFNATLVQAMKKIDEFAPDSLVISLGVDTARDDPEGEFLLDEADYVTMGQIIRAGGHKRMVVVQEGGYGLDVLGRNVVAFLRGITGN